MSTIALKIAGALHQGWKEVTVNLTIESISGAFHLNVSDKWQNGMKPRQIKPGDSCEVAIDGEVVITGYVDTVEPAFDDLSHGITVTGRDKSGDLFDCSVINQFQFKGLKIEQIATKICEPFGITVKTETDTGDKIPIFNIEQGMSGFEAIQKLCKIRGCLAYSDGKGGIIIARAGTEKINDTLIQAKNVLKAQGKYDFTERFSQYICKGQKQGDDNSSTDAITKPKAVVNDENITRYRPLIIIADGQIDTKKAMVRAKWEASVRRGKSRTFTIPVQGWKRKDGSLWPLNKLVAVKSQWLGLADTLLIAGINYKLDHEGEIAELALIPPEAYEVLPEDTIKKKTGNSAENNPYISG